MWYAEERLVSILLLLRVPVAVPCPALTVPPPLQGPERVKGLYAFRSILDHGGRITLGSDFPVEELNPLAAFYAAITRLSSAGTSPHGPEGW